jgi:hypothetical protein
VCLLDKIMQPNQTNIPPIINPNAAPNQLGAPAAMPQKQIGATQAPSSNPNSTQNSLLISEIRDGVAIMNDGSFRSVVLAKSINFDLMSEQEREAVEFAYQGFINSLYFDIQIVIKSRKIDMRPYLDRLQNIHNNLDNMLLAMLMEDYIYFITDLVSQSNIMSKQFYIVIPFYPAVSSKQALAGSKKLLDGIFEKKGPVVTINEADLEKAKSELKNRVGAVLDGLQQMGVQGAPLDTQELIELYYNSYNPDTAPQQALGSTDAIGVPVISKGEGSASRPYVQAGEL